MLIIQEEQQHEQQEQEGQEQKQKKNEELNKNQQKILSLPKMQIPPKLQISRIKRTKIKP